MISPKIMMVIISLLSMNSVIFILTWDSNNDLMQMIRPFFEFSDEVLDKRIKLLDRKNIFFLETSTSEVENFDLSTRQACSIESAAKMNPGVRINLLIFNNANFSSTTMEKLDTLSAYKNIELARFSVEDYLKNTPIEEWWKTGIIKTSIYPDTHTSDILRFVTLWKFGGIYLDLDMIVIKELENMTNFAAWEENGSLNSAALAFSKTGIGKKIANDSLEYLKSNFQGREWATNGPGLITKVISKLCGTHIYDMNEGLNCEGFTVHPVSAFYPIHLDNWNVFFEEERYSATMGSLNQSFAVHIWNSHSKGMQVKVDSQVPYATLASKYCPKIYSKVRNYF